MKDQQSVKANGFEEEIDQWVNGIAALKQTSDWEIKN